MVNLTAIIRCRADSVETVLQALIAVGHHAKAREPGTLSYRVVRSPDHPNVLITQERYKERAAMETHNSGEGTKTFFAATEGLLDGVEIYMGDELFDF